MTLGLTVPILRILNEGKAREFYVDFLGFRVDWEHRFESDLPLYMQVSRDACVLHLSEHYGDSTPGSAIRIDATDLDGFHAELAAKRYKYARPGIEQQPWGEGHVREGPLREQADVHAERAVRRDSVAQVVRQRSNRGWLRPDTIVVT